MSSAKRVAWLGGVAVALGMGAALTTGHGIAGAETTDSASTSDPSGASASAGDNASDATSDSTTGAAPVKSPESSVDTTGSATPSASGASDSSDSATTTSELSRAAEPGKVSATGGAHSSTNGSKAGADTGSATRKRSTTVRHRVNASAAETSEATSPAATRNGSAAADTQTVPTAEATAPVARQETISRTLTAAETTSPTPVAPARLPILTAVLNWIGREIEYSLLNVKPTASPYVLPQRTETTTTVSPVVIGSINAVAPYGDPVTYRIVRRPANGTVDVNADGSFVYTPDADLAAAGGSDAFVVRIIDNAFHLGRLFGLPRHSATVPIAVNVEQAALQSGATTGYDVFNTTQFALKLVGFNNVSNGTVYQPASGPIVGTVLQSGQSAHFEVNPNTDVIPIYEQIIPNWPPVSGQPPPPHPPEYYYAFLNTLSSTPQVGCAVSTSGIGTCGPGGGLNKGTQVLFMDMPGTVVTVPAGDQAQSDLLNNLCDSVGTCTYETTAEPIIGYGNAHLPTGFAPVVNNTDVQDSTSISISDATATAQTWSVSSTVKLTNLTKTVEASITASFGQTVTETHTFTQTVTANIPPHTEVFIFGATPIYRYWGNWHVVAGNTEWILTDVWFDTPNPAGNPVYVIDSCAVGSQECLDYTTGNTVNTEGLPPPIPTTKPQNA